MEENKQRVASAATQDAQSGRRVHFPTIIVPVPVPIQFPGDLHNAASVQIKARAKARQVLG